MTHSYHPFRVFYLVPSSLTLHVTFTSLDIFTSILQFLATFLTVLSYLEELLMLLNMYLLIPHTMC